MKSILFTTAVALMSLSLAYGDDPKPQPCDSSWDSCAVGRSDFQTPGRYIIDVLFMSREELSKNTPLLGEGVNGAESNMVPYVEAIVAPGSTDVTLQVPANSGYPEQTLTIGKILEPIGTDTNTYYTRQVVLNPGVKFSESSNTITQKYCDPGGVFGAVNYIEQITKTDAVITGASTEPFKFHTEKMKILHSYPAIFGCH